MSVKPSPKLKERTFVAMTENSAIRAVDVVEFGVDGFGVGVDDLFEFSYAVPQSLQAQTGKRCVLPRASGARQKIFCFEKKQMERSKDAYLS